ncbi:Rft protein-domain-containing protein [Tribonema minus]|uniref:Protein RFT1 homolog n=1 Tax=Tribonema minus TaxID=303371 RepID=A0A835YPZ4_9STRA|nr:Rft protein-domain-containing protein [Tribonema minus]
MLPISLQAAGLVCLAAALELACEPAVLIFQWRLMLGVRVRAEAAAVLILGVAKYLLVTRAGLGVVAFGYAQLLHSCALIVAYAAAVTREVRQSSVRVAAAAAALRGSEGASAKGDGGGAGPFGRAAFWLPGGAWGQGSTQQVRLVALLGGQSAFKHLLTEGDKIVLARAHGHRQGVYAIAHNYGSLVARLVFQPVEESARLMFARLGSSGGGNGSTSGDDGHAEADHKAQLAELLSVLLESVLVVGGVFAALGFHHSARCFFAPRAQIHDFSVCLGSTHTFGPQAQLGELLSVLLKSVLLVGGVFAALGFHHTRALLSLLMAGGRAGGDATLGEVADVLSWYCLYVPCLAVNGMCEAFVYALAGAAQRRFRDPPSPPPSPGMLFRIAYSARFIVRFFGSPRPLLGALPHPAAALAFAGAAVASGFSAAAAARAGNTPRAQLLHVCRGAAAFALLAAVCWATEKPFRARLRGLLKCGSAEGTKVD